MPYRPRGTPAAGPPNEFYGLTPSKYFANKWPMYALTDMMYNRNVAYSITQNVEVAELDKSPDLW